MSDYVQIRKLEHSARQIRTEGLEWPPSPVRFSGMMMLLLLRPAAARFSYRVIENRRH
jgi:hypothetical protein